MWTWKTLSEDGVSSVSLPGVLRMGALGERGKQTGRLRRYGLSVLQAKKQSHDEYFI